MRSRGSSRSDETSCCITCPLELSTTVIIAEVPSVDQPTTRSPVSSTMRELRSSVRSCVVEAAFESESKNWNWPISAPEQSKELSTSTATHVSSCSKNSGGASVEKRSATNSTAASSSACVVVALSLDDARLDVVSSADDEVTGVVGVAVGSGARWVEHAESAIAALTARAAELRRTVEKDITADYSNSASSNGCSSP